MEIPIETVYENNRESHFNPIWDSIKIYSVIMKYSLASLLSVLVDNGIFIILSTYMDNIYVMTLVGRGFAGIFNFAINKKIVFKKQGSILIQSIRYLLLLLLSGSISALCVTVLHKLFSMNVIVLKLMIELILYFINFYLQKNFVFGREAK